MIRYITRRILLAIPTLIGISLLIFIAMRVLPGDPLRALTSESGTSYILTEAQLQAARRVLGLDRPYHEQYLDWISSVLRGDLGSSFWNQTSVSDILRRRGPITAQIALMATALSWIIGLPVGLLCAVRRGSFLDHLFRVFITLFMAIPSFWLALLLILFAVSFFRWRPPLGVVYFWDNPLENLKITLGPSVVLGIGLAADVARITRSSTLEVLSADYVRVAYSKGLSKKVVLLRHVLRNALLPIVTVSGLMLAFLLGGSVAVERAFAVPGLGDALVQAIQQRDWMVIQNLVLLYGAVFVFLNLITDIGYAVIDPRISYT